MGMKTLSAYPGIARVVACLVCCLIAPTIGAENVRPARELALSVELHPPSGEATEHEPVLALVTVTNPLETRVEVWGRESAIRLAVYDSDGKLLTPEVRPTADGFRSIIKLDGKGKRTFAVMVSRWHHLAKAGRYVIKVDFWDLCGYWPEKVIASCRRDYEVKPFCKDRLLRCCEALTSRADTTLRGLMDVSDILTAWRHEEMKRDLDNLALTMLADVRHEIALPYLMQIARLRRYSEAFAGIRWVGTKTAREILEKLAESGDEGVSKLAKRELAMWDKPKLPAHPWAVQGHVP